MPVAPDTAAIAALRNLSLALFDDGSSPGLLREKAIHAFERVADWCGLATQDGLGAPPGTRLEHGEAISPMNAARCLTDFQRTRQFVHAVDAALAELAVRFPGQALRVVYAGCGPAAPLFLLPMMERERRGCRTEIQWTLIDLHAHSLDTARRLAQLAGMGGVAAYVEGDACTWEPIQPPHLVITETMQAALRKEPQVAVTGHLAPKLAAGGILIPERIRVSAALMQIGHEFSTDADLPRPDRVELATLLDVSLETAGQLHPFQAEPVRVRVPRVEHDQYWLALRTGIEVFGRHKLGDYDSGLTCPIVLGPIRAADTPAEYEFSYDAGPEPQFRWQRLA